MANSRGILHFKYSRPLAHTYESIHELAVPRMQLWSWSTHNAFGDTNESYEATFDQADSLRAIVASHDMLTHLAREEATSYDVLASLQQITAEIIHRTRSMVRIDKPTIGMWPNNYNGVDIGIPLRDNDRLVQEHLAIAALFGASAMSKPAVHTPHIRLARLPARPVTSPDFESLNKHMPAEMHLHTGILEVGIITTIGQHCNQ